MSAVLTIPKAGLHEVARVRGALRRAAHAVVSRAAVVAQDHSGLHVAKACSARARTRWSLSSWGFPVGHLAAHRAVPSFLSSRDDASMATDLELFADYFQIHVLDEESEGDFGDVWTDQTIRDGLAVTEDALAIGTAVNSTVAVGVHVLADRPDDDSDDFDHVVEASFHAPSGRLIVMGCTDYLADAARFDVPAGWTRARASRRNLAAAVRRLESYEGPEATEEVRLQVWPAPSSPPRVVKRWTQPES
ncbi:hypothetical protein [Streptomyces sp. NPDC058955]|uniref:hypothetical protein n=1 Tax=unclassified Streptomyces TaxID=2593676 RepID=UPI00365705CB